MAGAAPTLVVEEDAEHVAVAALDLVVQCERDAIRERGVFSISLAGGSTPRRLYELLAADGRPSFDCWTVLLGDERWVPADHPDSNYRMARQSLLDHVPIPRSRIHPVDTAAGSPAKGASLYEMTVRRALAGEPGHLPVLDLALLGLGPDGHTASLFPGSTALHAGPHQIAVATYAPSMQSWRVTLTAAMLSAARAALFLVSGEEKAIALSRVIDGDAADPPPASLVRSARTLFVADRAAAARLDSAAHGGEA